MNPPDFYTLFGGGIYSNIYGMQIAGYQKGVDDLGVKPTKYLIMHPVLLSNTLNTINKYKIHPECGQHSDSIIKLVLVLDSLWIYTLVVDIT